MQGMQNCSSRLEVTSSRNWLKRGWQLSVNSLYSENNANSTNMYLIQVPSRAYHRSLSLSLPFGMLPMPEMILVDAETEFCVSFCVN